MEDINKLARMLSVTELVPGVLSIYKSYASALWQIHLSEHFFKETYPDYRREKHTMSYDKLVVDVDGVEIFTLEDIDND